MDRLERLGRESKYDSMVKPPCTSAVVAGKRRPAYINYTPEGRKKEASGSSPKRKEHENGSMVGN